MKRIVFDCERMKYANTGIYSYCFQLGMRLQQQANPRNEEVIFFTPPSIKGIFGKHSGYILQNSLQKFWLPSLRKYDIWHSTYQNSHYLPLLDHKIKVVLTIHDLNFLYDQKKSQAKKAKYLRYVQKNIRRSSAIVTISEFAKSDILRNCDVGNRAVVAIHNGTNSLEAPVLLGNSYRPRARFLFSIGVVNRKKNFHVLLPLLQQNSDIELLIAGPADDPDYLHFMKDRARILGVEEKLRVLGPISEAEKSWYYSHCYAFAFPSLSEGFGLPVAEAMSVGKPVFLSDRTALPEIGRDVAFYFHDFNEQRMQHVFTRGMEDYTRDKMEDRIRQRSTDFCWRRAASQYLELYRSL
ncbi:MAG: glycosyltransferase family 4 protein [Flavisolibacter sp.]|nr:glycosyltransferase family 4 protein [Flavisolibacter sp.]